MPSRAGTPARRGSPSGARPNTAALSAWFGRCAMLRSCRRRRRRTGRPMPRATAVSSARAKTLARSAGGKRCNARMCLNRAVHWHYGRGITPRAAQEVEARTAMLIKVHSAHSCASIAAMHRLGITLRPVAVAVRQRSCGRGGRHREVASPLSRTTPRRPRIPPLPPHHTQADLVVASARAVFVRRRVTAVFRRVRERQTEEVGARHCGAVWCCWAVLRQRGRAASCLPVRQVVPFLACASRCALHRAPVMLPVFCRMACHVRLLSAQSRQRGWSRQVAAIIGCEDRAKWLHALG